MQNCVLNIPESFYEIRQEESFQCGASEIRFWEDENRIGWVTVFKSPPVPNEQTQSILVSNGYNRWAGLQNSKSILWVFIYTNHNQKYGRKKCLKDSFGIGWELYCLNWD